MTTNLYYMYVMYVTVSAQLILSYRIAGLCSDFANMIHHFAKTINKAAYQKIGSREINLLY